MEETVKKVLVPYVVDDSHASGPLGRIAHGAEGAGHATEKLKEKFKEFRGESMAMAAGMLGVGFGLGALIEKAGEANKEFGGAQKAIASTMATILDWPRTMQPVERFTRSMALSKNVTRELDETAAKFGMGLGDLADAYKTIGVSAGPLHLTQERWMDLAKKSAAAAKQFGISGAEAADTIGKALMGKPIKAAGDLGKFLVNEVGKPIKGISHDKILDKLDKALLQSEGIAAEMGKGFSGSLGRIQNRVDDLVRDLSGPLFHAIGDSLDSFANRLGQIGENGKPLIETYANKLVSAFETLQRVTSFLLDHWKQIAAVWAGMKIAGGISGLAGSMGKAGGLGAMLKGSGSPSAGARAGVAVEQAGGLYDRVAGARHATGEGAGIMGPVARIQQLKEQMDAIPMGERLSPGGQRETAAINKEVVEKMQAVADQFHALGVQDYAAYKEKMVNAGAAVGSFMSNQEVKDTLGMNKEAFSKLSDLLTQIVTKKDILSWQGPTAASETDANRKTTGKPQVVFTGENHFEFKWEDVDPDKAMLRFKDDMENYVGRRTSSVLSDPFGD